MTKTTAYDKYMRINKRQYRANTLAAHIMQKISDALYEADQKHRNLNRFVHNALLETFISEGIDIVTDLDRQQYGLPPRDEYGWTLEELHALEQKKLELMTRPMPAIIDIDRKTKCPVKGK